MYIMIGNKFELPISLHLFKGMAEEKALVDSGATKNFINQNTVNRLQLETKKMKEPVTLQNIDSTSNQAGKITHFLDLVVSRGNKKITE